MLSNLLRSGFSQEALIMVLLSIPVILFSLSIHECAHGYAAKLLGDHTAYNLGRLSLSPIKHLDPFGTLMMFLFGFGWAKPVPINTRNFRNPKWGMAISALAGPVSNLLSAYIFFVIANAINVYIPRLFTLNDNNYFIILAAYLLFAVGYQLNISLAIFNLLPVPPLDGSRILFVLLPTKYYFAVMKYEQYISIAIMILLFTGLLSTPLSILVGAIEKLFELSIFWMV